MRRLSWLIFVPVAVIAAECDRGSKPAVDEPLKNDLGLASQAQAFNPQQVLGPNEAGYAAQQQQQQQQYAPRTIQTVARRPVTTARRTTTARRSSSSSGGYYPAPEPPEQE